MKPMLKDGISLGIIQDGSDTIYYAENADGNRFEISRLLWDVLEKTDGSYQLDLPNKTIPLLKAMGLVRTSRFVHMKGLNSYFTLFPISNRTKDPRRWKILLYILYILSLLLFGSGFLIWASNSIRIGPVFDGTLIGCLLFAALFYSSIFLHEIGHFIAAKAFGIKTTEIGVFLFGIIITGAYTSYLRESKRDLSVLERILFSEAGIIVNLLIAGLCLIFASVYYPLSYSLTISADFIILMVITDLLPGAKHDGEAFFDTVFGVKSTSASARRCLHNRSGIRVLLKSGVPGYATLCAFGFSLASPTLVFILTIIHALYWFLRVS